MTQLEEGPRTSRTQTPGKRWIRRLVKTALWLLIAYFLYRYLKRNWTLLDFRQVDIPPGALGLSALLFCLGSFTHGMVWVPLLHQVGGVKMSLLTSWRICATLFEPSISRRSPSTMKRIIRKEISLTIVFASPTNGMSTL